MEISRYGEALFPVYNFKIIYLHILICQLEIKIFNSLYITVLRYWSKTRSRDFQIQNFWSNLLSTKFVMILEPSMILARTVVHMLNIIHQLSQKESNTERKAIVWHSTFFQISRFWQNPCRFQGEGASMYFEPWKTSIVEVFWKSS